MRNKERQNKGGGARVGIAMLTAGMLIFNGGCKPTERNYAEAYDRAIAKREAKDPDAAIIYGNAKVHTLPGVTERVINGDTVPTSYMTVRPLEGETLPETRPIRVVVAVFKMKANAEALASDLKKEGYDAAAGMGTGERFVTLGGSFDSIEKAAAFVKEYRRKGRPTVGLPEGPVVIF